jgi:crotonobetainyl-CoA:carnitine CoA-transferase CaiB-like acyl-CoA transferase
VFTALPFSSGYAAIVGASAVAAALLARERDGLGQHVVVPLFDATFSAVGLVGQRFVDRPPVAARPPAWVRQYRCKDGRWVQFHAANTRFIEQFVRAAGVEAWRADGLLDRARTAADPALGALLMERMTALFETRTAQEWEDLVNAAGTPTAICRESAEWLVHPHARASGAVIEVDDPVLGTLLQPGITPRLDATPGAVGSAAPAVSEDAAAWRSGGASHTRERRTASNAAPLAGVKVLDLCIILAGPTCGRTLAEFGADVIKIDAPGREGGIAFHHDVNRGKRSLLLDLKSEAGQEVFWRLAEDADVVVQNYRAGALERIGLGYDQVRQRKPGIIYASLNAYGHGGPWEHRPGWEQLAQAATGMQMRYGGDHPVLAPFPVNDYGTGILGAYGVMLALLHRGRTGEGQRVRSALAYTAGLLQSAVLQQYRGKAWDEPRGQDALGADSLYRLYEAADGWFFLAAREADVPALTRVDGLAGLAELSPRKRDAFLADRFALENTATWVARLKATGAGAHEAVGVPRLMADPYVVSRGLSVTREHDSVGRVTTNGPAQWLSRSPVTAGRPAAIPGADAASIFEEYGLASQLETLAQAGVVKIEGP